MGAERLPGPRMVVDWRRLGYRERMRAPPGDVTQNSEWRDWNLSRWEGLPWADRTFVGTKRAHMLALRGSIEFNVLNPQF